MLELKQAFQNESVHFLLLMQLRAVDKIDEMRLGAFLVGAAFNRSWLNAFGRDFI
jgi:hypothetical protein